jgi:protein TonB
MSEKDPKSAPASAQPVETLEDAVYRSSLSESNKALRRTNPWISIPAAVGTYGLAALLVVFVATKTEAGKKVIETTMGIDLTDPDDKKDHIEEEPPPPPPAPPPMAAAPLIKEVEDAPPPPPPTDQEIVPEVAPDKMPTVDYSKSYGRTDADLSGGGSITGVVGGTAGPAGSGGGPQSSSTTIHDFSFNQLEKTYTPPQPTYPPIARAAKQSGRVTVQMVIGTDGVPTSATAISGPALLRKDSEAYAMKWRFKPAMEDGRPISVRFNLNVDWKL